MLDIWLDKFLFVTVLLVSFFTFIDWLIGESKRAQMRERIGEFWLHLHQSDLSTLFAETSVQTLKILERIRGKRWKTLRLISFSVLTSLLIFVIFAVVTSGTSHNSSFNQRYFINLSSTYSTSRELILGGFSAELASVASALGMMIANIITGMLSILITIKFITLLIKHFSLLVLPAYLIIDILFALLAVMFTLPLGHFFSVTISAELMPYSFSDGLPYSLSDEVPNFYYINEFWGRYGIVGRWVDIYQQHYEDLEDLILYGKLPSLLILFNVVILISGLWPTMLHIIQMFILVILRLTQPITQPLISAVAYAFYDSKKGVLTTLAIGLGIIAKLLQIWSKM